LDRSGDHILARFVEAVLTFKRSVMKKSDITASLLIIITCVLLVIFLGLRSIDGYVGGGGTAPSYRFLAGREPISFKKADKGNEDRRYTYSFETDFNDLCSKADAELKPAGFFGNTISIDNLFGNDSSCRIYYRKERFPRGPVLIYIYDNRQYIEFPDSKKGALSMKDGWVMLEVVCGRGWQWPF
jgi:hypothetical protein